MDGKKFKMGWMIVAFDLPVKSKQQRKQATGFRKFLLGDGYKMIQFSFYARPMVTYARMRTHLARVTRNIPPEGSVRSIYVTKAQWERAFIIHGNPAMPQSPERMPRQLELW
jgi:CRISPR-associated protein Cas2